jgi:peptidoglycan/xylan/chitin deacetylase (PgdA/CDA1 family)
MYHYVRPDNENVPGSTPEKLSILPENFDRQMAYLRKLEDEKKVRIIHFSDLEKYDKSHCYPNQKLVLLTSDDGWDDGYRFIFPIIQKYRIPFHFAIIANRVAKGDERIDTFMNESEIQKMLSSPLVELLSHSYTHSDMPKEDEKDLRHELCDSKDFLESTFKVHINTFVYPVGHYKPFVEDMVRKCGYRYGLVIKNLPFLRLDS